ncbi:di-heme oxidoredictase family protein [Thalassotalea crassostreae]|uniref:di-heme oxidoredictase family protein n=1 Tax=Thalassotalea crassostreae TaxID=1763536 RepID=UPI000839539D|nr:di-heme oxidoredictase family protein [Thalassotalea crassostreae]
MNKLTTYGIKHIRKRVEKILVLFLTTLIFSCGGGSSDEVDTVDTQVDQNAGSEQQNSNNNNSDNSDADNDGVVDSEDSCPNSEAQANVGDDGCDIHQDLLEVAVNYGVLVGGENADKPGFTLYVFDDDLNTDGSNCIDSCASAWPPVLVTDGIASGIDDLTTIVRSDGTLQAAYRGRPLYYYVNDLAAGDVNGSDINGWDIQLFQYTNVDPDKDKDDDVVPEPDPNLGDIVPLYNALTEQEPAILYETDDAVITKFADRGRDRHAKEDQFQQYDHYLSHYWTHRTARFKFTDYVAKGGSSIKVEWVSEWKLQALEFRAWYSGMNTVAEYHGNYEPQVVVEGKGTFDNDLQKTSSQGDQYKYSLVINDYRALNGSSSALAIGQYMEVEISQFLDGVPEGRANYYGTTYLYQVGKGGMVPWKTVGDFAIKSSERENSHPIDKSGWLGGDTTLPYQYTNEPNDHFMQMATNLSSVNGQPFVLGRRVLHTSFVDGQHDEDPANGKFNELSGKAGPHFINESCTSCHERNGRAAPAEVNENLDKWVFKIADSYGDSESSRGNVLQPRSSGDVIGEGEVSIASWTEENGLRSPNYQFSKGAPAKFSARIAPQLVGLGLLEAVSEESILALADENDEFAPFGISGKAQKVIDPVTKQTRLGRFGWKAGTGSIKHQVAAALNTDMGVMTSVLPTPDCGATQKQNNECGSNTTELSDEHLENLVKYISLLGVRAQRNLDDAGVQNGKVLFNNIGCVDCHTDTLTTSEHHPLTELVGQTIHPYSDMLLHDMGEGLADNLGEGLATGAEWRTTPLWGIGLSACVTGGVINPIGGQGNEVCSPVHSYLHDGRARTIDEAILWHGGESEASKVKYQQLSASDKEDLLSFLNSL